MHFTCGAKFNIFMNIYWIHHLYLIYQFKWTLQIIPIFSINLPDQFKLTPQVIKNYESYETAAKHN